MGPEPASPPPTHQAPCSSCRLRSLPLPKPDSEPSANILKTEKLYCPFCWIPHPKYGGGLLCSTHHKSQAPSKENRDPLSPLTPLSRRGERSQCARAATGAILHLQVLTDRLRRIHVWEILDVVTSVSSQQHVKDSLGFNDPFFWEEKEERDRKG